MIITLPKTTSNVVNKRLVNLRDEGGAVALGRVLTLVIEGSADDIERAIKAANDASREHPCRIIAIVLPDERPKDAANSLDAEIRVGGDAGASEVILLHPTGVLLDHLDTLVIPLLLPDAPIVVWWPHLVPENPSEHPIGRFAQRRITDTTMCADPIRTLTALRDNYTAGDTDLAWTKITLWRGLMAATLDQPPHTKVTRAEVEGSPRHSSVDMLAAWLAQELRVPVTIRHKDDAEAITAARLWRGDDLIELSRPPDGTIATLKQPGSPDRTLSLPLRQLHECLSEELRRLDPDENYGEVLTKGLARVGR